MREPDGSMIDYRLGDTRTLGRQLPPGTVSLITGSPPFLNLRAYSDDDREIGREQDPAEFIDTLLELCADWARALTSHGSIAIELGDTMAGTSFRKRVFGAHAGDWPNTRSLCGIPEAFQLSLTYGRNVLTGTESPAGRWRVVNSIVWHRTNPPTGNVGDRCKFSKSTIIVATQARKGERWADVTALRDDRGGLPLDTWIVPTQPSALDHPAPWPPEIARRLIAWNCPAEVCVACGEPRRRIEEVPEEVRTANRERTGWVSVDAREEVSAWSSTSFVAAVPVTLGWTDCGCNAGWTEGTVVDPFAGSGTTLAVADILGRSAIGFDLDPKCPAMYPARLAECRRTLLGARPGSTFGTSPTDAQPGLFDEEPTDVHV